MPRKASWENVIKRIFILIVHSVFVFQLLSKPKYSSVEKIKTIGSTYMAAAGLQPGRNKKRVSMQQVRIHLRHILNLNAT